MCGCTESGVETLEFLIEQNITINYIVSLDEEQAKKLVLSGYDHDGKSIDWDKCRSDAFDFEIDSVQDGYITIVEPD